MLKHKKFKTIENRDSQIKRMVGNAYYMSSLGEYENERNKFHMPHFLTELDETRDLVKEMFFENSD